MFKKILTLLMSMSLILSLVACSNGTTTVQVTRADGSTETIVLEPLKSQLEKVTTITEYTDDTSIDRMDTITFGFDANSNPIKWIVLEKNGNQALIVSKYILTYQAYNSKYVDITWENCTIRDWLNSKFINTIFSKNDQGAILTTDVVNRYNAEYGISGGNNTKDKLFLLSIDEVNKYFSDDQRTATVIGEGPKDWWLRSPGSSQLRAAYVDRGGDLLPHGEGAPEALGVRPALWVKY